MDQKQAEQLVRRMASALRGGDLYSPTHPLVQRRIDGLAAAATEALQTLSRSASIPRRVCDG